MFVGQNSVFDATYLFERLILTIVSDEIPVIRGIAIISRKTVVQYC